MIGRLAGFKLGRPGEHHPLQELSPERSDLGLRRIGTFYRSDIPDVRYEFGPLLECTILMEQFVRGID